MYILHVVIYPQCVHTALYNKHMTLYNNIIAVFDHVTLGILKVYFLCY